MYKHTPKINGLIGYRTGTSMKNEQTWRFANEYCGRLWIKLGSVLLLLTIVAHLLLIHSSIKAVSILCVSVITIQCIMIFVSIYFVERVMKNTFDKDGNPIPVKR